MIENYIQCDDKIKNNFGSALVIQIAERFEENTEKVKWKTIVEVANVVPDDSIITRAECTAAVEAVWIELEAFVLTWMEI